MDEVTETLEYWQYRKALPLRARWPPILRVEEVYIQSKYCTTTPLDRRSTYFLELRNT